MRAKHMFVICAYQKSEYLEACIQSLKKQTLGSEIIVTTSTPNERIQSLCERYQLPLKIHENSTGIASDWNYGISQCKGAKYVTIAHQDDTYEPEYAEKVIAKLEKSENPIIAFTDYGEIRNGFVVNDTTLLEIKRKMLIPLQLEGLQNSRFVRRRILGFGDAISCPTVTYCMEQLGEKQPIFADNMRCALDWETWEVLSRMEGAFVYVPEILMHHRIHEESATTENIRASVRGEEEYKIYRKFWPKWMADLLISFYRKSEKYNEIPQEDKNLSQKVEKEACVSVVIPVYNGEAYLAKCLQSLRDQTWENLQIIVVDDGSKDGTREILIDFARVEDRLLVVGQEKGGVSTARNRGISAACGKYLLFVDADDQIPHDYVEKMVRTAEKHGAEMVLSGYDLISEQGEKIGSYRPDAREEWKYQISAAWGHLYRLDFWKKYELFFLQEKDARGEDLPISLFVNAVAKNYKVAPGAVYYYTQHPDSAMGSLSNGDWFGFPYGGIEKMHERIREIGIQTSEELYALGLIKLFAHFTFQIYRNAPEKEKKRLLVFFHQLLNEEEWKLCREAMRRIWKYPVFTTTQKGAMEAFWWQAVATRNRVKRSRYADRSVAPQWTTDSGTGDSSVSCPFGHGEIGLGTGDSSVGTGDSSVSSALVATCQTENCPLSHHPQARQRTVPCPTIPSQDRELSPVPRSPVPRTARTQNCPLSKVCLRHPPLQRTGGNTSRNRFHQGAALPGTAWNRGGG